MKNVRKILTLLLTACLVLGLTACASQPSKAVPEQPAEETQSTASEGSEQTAGQKPVLLAVSFGTSYNETRELTIGAIEEELQAAFPDYEVRRAFTAQTVIDILKERDGLEIDNVAQAMARLVLDGVREVVIQPTHVMPGAEYDDIIADLAAYEEQFDSFKVGSPLLTADVDYEELIAALAEETAAYNEEGTALVFMGHGTHHAANSTYASLQSKLLAEGYDNYFIGTVEAEPALEDVMAMVESYGAKKVVLLPLMIVAGDHASNDMAGDEEDSWKTAFEEVGYQVECVLKGLGQYPGVRSMIVRHAQETMDAQAPLSAEQIKDGSYEISVSSSSPMFRVTKCVLTVENGTMTAAITMSGDGYGKLYPGTGEEALAADESAFIPAELTEEGTASFVLPVEKLNERMNCAAWSIKKEKWYDRTLVFLSQEIPAEALITA